MILLCTARYIVRFSQRWVSCNGLLVWHTSGRTVSSSSMQGSAMSGACPPKRAQSQYTTPACPLPFPAAPSAHSVGGRCRARAASARHSCVRMAGELRACCSVSCTSVSCRLCTAESGSSSKSRCTCGHDADHEADRAVSTCSCQQNSVCKPHLCSERLRRKVLRINAAAVLQHACRDCPRLRRLLPLLQPVIGALPAGWIAVLQQRAYCLIECLRHRKQCGLKRFGNLSNAGPTRTVGAYSYSHSSQTPSSEKAGCWQMFRYESASHHDHLQHH